MIDDLTTHGITEPYRMFTSRAEHRLLLSQDNAEQRLLEKGHKQGLVSNQRLVKFKKKEEAYKKFIKDELKKIKTQSFKNNKNTTTTLKEKKSIYELLKRPDVNTKKLYKTTSNKTEYNRALNEIKYLGYIQKQQREINKNKKQNQKKIPANLNYEKINGLSNEAVEKLIKSKPTTIGSASRIEGITPAAINIILIAIKKEELSTTNA